MRGRPERPSPLIGRVLGEKPLPRLDHLGQAFGPLLPGRAAGNLVEPEIVAGGRAQGRDDVFGARMTGGGFGGCAIVLAQADQVDAITQAIQKDFEAKFGRVCPVFATTPADGAGVF